MSDIAFTPQKSYRLDVSTAAGTVLTFDGSVGTGQCMIWNSGANAVAISWGFGAAAAQAAFPTVGTPQNVCIVPPGAVVTYSIAPGAQISAITAVGSSTLYFTLGGGM